MLKFLMPLAAALVMAAGLPAAAQTKVVEKEVTVSSGQLAQIGLFGRVTQDCTNAPVSVTLEAKSLNGQVTAKQGRLSAGAIADCPELRPTAAMISYQSEPGFVGIDRATIIVTINDNIAERHVFTIKVE